MTQTDRIAVVGEAQGGAGSGPVAQPPLPEAARVPVAAGAPVRGGRLAALDGLRFLAALAVVLYHFVGQKPKTMEVFWGQPYQEVFPTAHAYFAYGQFGVDLFFLISGFVICMSAWGRTPRDFFISRVTRLYPMYWVAILISSCVLFFVENPFADRDPRIILANLTMLQRPLGVTNLDAVYWTLWPELCFYLTFAVVVWMGLTYQRVVVFAGLWTVAAVLAPVADLPLLTVLANPQSAPYFIAGMAFYLMYRFRPTPLLWGVVTMSWLLAVHFLLAPSGGRIRWETWSPSYVWLTLVTTVFFALIAAIALGWFNRIRWRWLTVAGTLTFPLYLLHDIIGITIINRGADRVDPWVLVGATTVGLIVLSYVVQRFVERPLAVASRRWLKSADFGWKQPARRR